MDFNESLIDFTVKSQTIQDKSNGKIKNNIEKEKNDNVETNRNKLEFKSIGTIN